MRHLILVLGDQLDHASSAFDGFDAARDAIVMIESAAEARVVWSHKARIAVFLSAMRHFRAALAERGWTVHYRDLAATAERTATCPHQGLHPSIRVRIVPALDSPTTT